jgi:type IV pilus assembly protein PilE
VKLKQLRTLASRSVQTNSEIPRARWRLHVGPRCNTGFTLIELMVTVAVVSILAMVAVPNYTDYIQRSRIIDATTGLNDMRNRLEQYFLDNRQYPASCIPAAPGPAPATSIYLPAGMKYFAVTCAFPTTTSYTVTATGLASDSMSAFAYTVDQANNRVTKALPAGWKGAGSTCWVTKKMGSC